MSFQCPICYENESNFSPCLFCSFSICNKCVNTMYFYNKYNRNVCPQCKTTDCYTHKSNLDDVHLYIKKLELEKYRKLIMERSLRDENLRQPSSIGCCIIC